LVGLRALVLLQLAKYYAAGNFGVVTTTLLMPLL
jgi:hypothetical protein